MWRKTDIKKRWQALYSAPQHWKEPFIQASPEIDDHGKKFVRATVVDRTSTDIAPTVLDPDVVTLTSLIEAGVTTSGSNTVGAISVDVRSTTVALTNFFP